MRWVILAAVFATACGGSSASSKPVAPSNHSEPAPAAVASPSSDVEDIEPGEPDRAQMCERAMDNVVRILGLTDQNEIMQTRTAGIRDCLASNATRDDIACFAQATRIEHLSHCHEFSNP